MPNKRKKTTKKRRRTKRRPLVQKKLDLEIMKPYDFRYVDDNAKEQPRVNFLKFVKVPKVDTG